MEKRNSAESGQSGLVPPAYFTGGHTPIALVSTDGAKGVRNGNGALYGLVLAWVKGEAGERREDLQGI
jgi:hypothetical protein